MCVNGAEPLLSYSLSKAFFFFFPHRLRCNITAPANLTERRKVFICTQMGLIWNNEYVLEKNKEPHKMGYFSTEATEMADNCFQVCRCSVNEFVQFCWQLTVSSFQFVSRFSHTGTLFDFLRFVFVFPLSGLHIYPLLGSLVALSFTFSLNLFSLLFSQFTTFFGVAAFYIFYLFCCFVRFCSLGANNRRRFCFAVDYSPQKVYLDSGSLILRYSSVTVITAPQ